MTPFRLHLRMLLLPLALGGMPLVLSQGARAQEIVQPPTPTADALAEQVRILAAEPRDVRALIAAGELATQLNDPAAAMGFFGRAQALDPNNPRIAAGKAGALVLLERPGEALRLYQQAERAGQPMLPYLAQRGLAYDLTGQPGYAQRDYRAALVDRSDDETVRRLALSLGVSGRRDEAMALLDPLLRRSDRGAWRARACILAMTGDAPGGARIATAMMPGGAALGPFLQRLPALSLADRAFAVHFGKLSSSVARANDARLAPAVAFLPPEPTPVPPRAQVATVTRADPREDRRGRRSRASGVRGQVAQAAPPLPPPPPVGSVAGSPAIAMFSPAPPSRAPLGSTPGTVVTAATAGMTIITPPRRNASGQRALSADPVRRTPVMPSQPAFQPPPRRTDPVAMTPTPPPTLSSGWAATADATPVRIMPTPTPTPTPVIVAAPPPPPAPAPVVLTSITTVPAPVVSIPVPTPPPPPPPPVIVAVATDPAPTPVDPPPAPTPEPVAAPVAAAPPRASAIDSIVGAISIPAAELEVRPPRVVPTVAKVPPKKVEVAKPDPKKAKPDPAKAEPARWWVQVAGGASVADLPREWSRAVAKAPAAFKGKGAWTTPLRATNRLLAGPFKAQAEAQAFVNAIGKDGLSAFAWQSEAGQKIAKLALK